MRIHKTLTFTKKQSRFPLSFSFSPFINSISILVSGNNKYQVKPNLLFFSSELLIMMDDDVVHRVLHEGGRDYYQQTPSTSSSSPSILQSLPLHAVRSIWVLLLWGFILHDKCLMKLPNKFFIFIFNLFYVRILTQQHCCSN